MNYSITEEDFKENYKFIYREPINLSSKPLNDRNLELDISKLKYTGRYIMDERLIGRGYAILYNVRTFCGSPHIKYMESFEFVNFTSRNKITIIAKMEKDEKDDLFICFYINLDLLNGKIDTFVSVLLRLAEMEKEKKIVNNFIESVKIPVKFNYNEEVLRDKKWLNYKNGWELYNYQKDDILFMENIEQENQVLNVYETPGFYKFRGCNFNLQGRFFNSEYPLFYEKLNLKGGCLINEMGLGKTLEMFELISRTKNEFNKNFKLIKHIGECNYFFKRGKNAGNSCCKKNIDGIFCKSHSKTPFIDKMKTFVNNKDNFKEYLNDELNKIEKFDKIEFESNCTLIVCPTQLCDQWCTEFYEKYKNSNLLISMISSIDTFKNTTLEELLLLDILIIPYTLLENIKYLNVKEYKTELINIWNNNYSSIFWDTKDRVNFIDKNINITKLRESINLSNIRFKRIVLDEFHEISKPNSLEKLNNLKSKHKWILTGTPFLYEKKSIKQYLNFLTDGKLYNYMIDYDNVPKIFKRNTKESIKNEWSCTKIDTTCNIINFTEIESVIYRSYKEQLNESVANKSNIIMNLLKICCCGDLLSKNLKIKIDNCKTFEEIQKVIIEENENILNELSIRIVENENEIKELNDNIENSDLHENLKNDFKMALGNKRRNLTNLRKEYESVNRGQVYLKSVIKSINNKEEWECAICLTESEDIDEIGITKCGHKFCWECLLFSIENCNRYNNMINCPQCKTYLKNEEYFLIKNVKKVTECSNLSKLVESTKSSKIGNIINYLRTKLDKKDYCIIFSQWDSLLKKVGDYIEKNEINVVYCNGTIYQRKSSIKKFNEESDTRIIMLSSENSASGLNLTRANKIIFIEPVYGTQIRKMDIENQAIGRANRIGQKKDIEIIKFIMKDTIEEDILNGKEINVDNVLTL